MRAYVIAAALLVFTTTAHAQSYHRGYTNQYGTYVQPHWQSSPNSTTLDNYSTRGNVNPYTGSTGTRDPYPSYNSGNSYGNSYGSTYSNPYSYNPYQRR